MKLYNVAEYAAWAFLLVTHPSPASSHPLSTNSIDVRNTASNRTADTSSLKTWWFNTGEINTKTHVQNENVRQSHVYQVQVASANDSDFYDSFVYETIPRNGYGQICLPENVSSVCDMDDGITIESDIGADMAWTQYLANVDSVVRVSRLDGRPIDADGVIIRPTNLDFNVQARDDAIFITVPFNESGYRFSVEFDDNLWEYRNSEPGLKAHYVQDKNASAENYVSTYNDSMPVVGVEPLNALLIFASPFPESQYVPNDEANTYYVPEGLVTGLDQVAQSIVYFRPGVYWFTGSAHAILSENTTWVYIAPGAYVKGAVQYESSALELRASGFGVLSGEQYVYQANTAEGYANIKSDNTSLRMWSGNCANGAQWTIHGLTTSAPPFNSMDFHSEDVTTLSIQASDYKQVGAFFGQTDGIQMYPYSYVRDVFYHVGDDGIKTYYSNVLCERMTVWKTNNAPIVQFGWYPRDVDNVTVDSVNVLHTRYINQETKYPRALVASAASYTDDSSTSTANISRHISNYNVTNWRCEGICPGIVGINPLENIDTMFFSNIWIEQLSPNTTGVGTSTLTVFTDGTEGNRSIALGDDSPNNLGLVIENFYVAAEHITLENNNWDLNSAGRLNFNESYWGRWTAR